LLIIDVSFQTVLFLFPLYPAAPAEEAGYPVKAF
jgi:hypothetical protein